MSNLVLTFVLLYFSINATVLVNEGVDIIEIGGFEPQNRFCGPSLFSIYSMTGR
jgi:hypothetical protein